MGRKKRASKRKGRSLGTRTSKRAKRSARTQTSSPNTQEAQTQPQGSIGATTQVPPDASATDQRVNQTPGVADANPLDLLSIALKDPRLVACHPDELDALAETIQRLRLGAPDNEQPIDEAQAMGQEPWREGADADVIMQIVRLLILGEEVLLPGAKTLSVRYPTYRELAQRFGVGHSTIGRISKSHQCLERRRAIQSRVQARASQRFVQRLEKRIEDVDIENADLLERIFQRVEDWLDINKKDLPPMKDIKILMELRSALFKRAMDRNAAQREDPVDAVIRLLKEEHLLGIQDHEQDDLPSTTDDSSDSKLN